MKNVLVMLVLCSALSGCAVGMPVFQAGGVATVVRIVDRRDISGQLIAAMPDHIVVLDNSRTMYSIYHSVIRSASFKGAGVLISSRRDPSDSVLTLISSLSAYPQGVSDSLLSAIRAAYSASGPTIIRQ